MNDSIVTLVTESVEGAFVSKDEPFASKRSWLQVRFHVPFDLVNN